MPFDESSDVFQARNFGIRIRFEVQPHERRAHTCRRDDNDHLPRLTATYRSSGVQIDDDPPAGPVFLTPEADPGTFGQVPSCYILV